MLRYDESELVKALSGTPRNARVMFAAACAERLQPLYAWFHETSGQGDPDGLRAALDAAWQAVLEPAGSEDLGQWQEAAELLVPDEEDEGWVDQSAYAQNAAAAVAYALRSWSADEPQDAGWAARQVYEAADYAAQRQLEDLDLNAPGAEDALLGRPVVQEALEGLGQDLRDVSRPGPTEQVAREVREKARAGGAKLARLVVGGTAGQ
jgi:hypothetical protein